MSQQTCTQPTSYTLDLMRVRKEAGVHCRSSIRIVKAEQSIYVAEIGESLCVKIGPGHFEPDAHHWMFATAGQDYCVWKRK